MGMWFVMGIFIILLLPGRKKYSHLRMPKNLITLWDRKLLISDYLTSSFAGMACCASGLTGFFILMIFLTSCGTAA